MMNQIEIISIGVYPDPSGDDTMSIELRFSPDDYFKIIDTINEINGRPDREKYNVFFEEIE